MRSKLSMASVALVLGFAFALYGAACSGQDNELDRVARNQEVNPDAGEFMDAGAEAAATLDYDDRASVFPDRTPNPANCSAQAGIELATFVDFEGGAAAWFKFDDGTAPIGYGLLPPDLGATNQAPTQPGWGLVAVTLDPPRCGSENALHFQGGKFSNWGGGLGSQYFKLTGALAEDNLPTGDENTLYSATELQAIDKSKVQGAGVNAKDYKGVALWARRGENSQSSFRLVLNDKYTSNDAARLQYNQAQGLPQFSSVPEGGPYCGRIRACTPAGSTCSNGKTCNQWSDDGNWYCFDPEVEEVTPATTMRCDTTSCTSNNDIRCTLMGETVECLTISNTDPMQQATFAPVDVLFEGKPCTPWTFSDNFLQTVCYDPETDPEPPNENERCDNGWSATIIANTNWAFYLIPWSEFAQNDTLLLAPDFATDSIYSIGISFAQGTVDFYVDDISFYR